MQVELTLNVFPFNLNVVVPIRPRLLMVESYCMNKLTRSTAPYRRSSIDGREAAWRIKIKGLILFPVESFHVTKVRITSTAIADNGNVELIVA